MKKFLLAILALFALAQVSFAQISANVRVAKVEITRGAVGTSTAAAITPSAVGGNLYMWKICNDAVNTSTHLLVGKAVDVSTDGVMLGKGECFDCPNCSPQSLKDMKVEAQAASNGYTVVQYRQ